MPDALTTPQQAALLKGLRNGDYKVTIGGSTLTILPIKETLTAKAIADFGRFNAFLVANGYTNPQSEDLYLTVVREDFLNLLRYADDRQCLILQSCFGFDSRLTNSAGRVRLVQKGNFHQVFGRKDDDFFDPNHDTIYRNGDGNLEFFQNMRYSEPIFAGDGLQFIENFRAIYSAHHGSFIFGYLLPVKPLLRIVSDPAYSFIHADMLTFRWGLTAYDASAPNELGNFTLVIGTHDLLTSTTIEFRVEIVKFGDGDLQTACPPNSGC